MRTMKMVVSVVVLVLAILLITPFFIGQYAESRLQKTIGLLNQNGSLQISVNHYQRHWFTSAATIQVTITDPKFLPILVGLTGNQRAINGFPVLTAAVSISHGPVFLKRSGVFPVGVGIANIAGTLMLPEKGMLFSDANVNDPTINQLRGMLNLITGKAAADIQLQLGLTGKTDVTLTFHDFLNELLLSKQITLVNQGAPVLSFSLGRNGKSVKGYFKESGFTLNANDKAVSLPKGVRISFDRYQYGDRLWLGSTGFDLPVIESTLAGKMVSSWQGIKWRSLDTNNPATQKGLSETLSSEHQLVIQVIEEDGKRYGPFESTVQIKNIDMTAMEQLNTLMQQFAELHSQKTRLVLSMRQRHTQPSKPSKYEQAAAFQLQAKTWMLQKELVSLFPSLVAQGASIDVAQLSLKTPKGDVKGHVALTFADKAKPQQEPNHSQTLFATLKSATLDVDLEMPAVLLESLLTQTTAMRFELLEDQLAKRTEMSQTNLPTPSQAMLDKAEKMTQQRLDDLIQTGVLVKRDGIYHFALSYKDNTFYLNQTQTNITELLNKLVGQAQTLPPAAVLPAAPSATSLVPVVQPSGIPALVQ